MEEPSDSEERGTGFMQDAHTLPLITRCYTFKSVVLILHAARESVYLMYPVQQGTTHKNWEQRAKKTASTNRDSARGQQLTYLPWYTVEQPTLLAVAELHNVIYVNSDLK